ncbi:MAG: class I fructose-bisphosphate aldolase [Gammaproteobacteria bacterium]|jgi:class I fructose-bisphosphate aldolase
MNSPRLNRLFRANGRCVILSFDHGLFGEPSWLKGLENIADVVNAIASSEAHDGMTLPNGSARVLQARMGRDKPSLLLRVDVTDAYLNERPAQLTAYRLDSAVARAVALDAVCVVAALLTYPDQPGLSRDCFANLDALRRDCDIAGMPLMVEILAMTDNRGVPLVQTNSKHIAPLVRQAMELGADLIKADPTEPVEDFSILLDAAAGVPIIASGGIKADDEDILTRSAALMDAGASGLAYGRNIMWAKDPALMTRVLLQVVHEGVSAEEAIERYREQQTSG